MVVALSVERDERRPRWPGWVVASIATGSVTERVPGVSITNGASPGMAKSIVSVSGVAFAAVIASRIVQSTALQPSPSAPKAVVLTVKVWAPPGAAVATLQAENSTCCRPGRSPSP